MVENAGDKLAAVIKPISKMIMGLSYNAKSTTISTLFCTREKNMHRIRFDQDIQPLSEFRSGVASYIKQVNETRRPLVLTQRGKGVAVLLDIAEYEAMQEKIEILEEIQQAEIQLASGQGVNNADARTQVLAQLNK
jgi:antitoxin YefM